MRKLKLQVQMTMDGFMAGPNGEMDFAVWDWDEPLKQYTEAITSPVDCIVLGRKLAEGFIPYWADVAAHAEHPEQAAGVKFTNTPKVVFTKTLGEAPWGNTVLAKGNLVEEVTHLKNQEGQDIIVYGGATFVSSLIQYGLIDELHLYVNPAAIGNGMPIFSGLDSQQAFTLVKATPFACGIVVLHYEPKRV